jgi:hypothetical protein
VRGGLAGRLLHGSRLGPDRGRGAGEGDGEHAEEDGGEERALHGSLSPLSLPLSAFSARRERARERESLI